MIFWSPQSNRLLKRGNSFSEITLNELNQDLLQEAGEQLSDHTVHKDAKILDWECLKLSFRPQSAKFEDALASLGGYDAETRFNYLKNRLRLIQIFGAARDRFQFTLDPLAEYLAAMYWVDLCSHNEYDLKLMSLENVAALPPEGQDLVIVAKICNFYHVRISEVFKLSKVAIA